MKLLASVLASLFLGLLWGCGPKAGSPPVNTQVSHSDTNVVLLLKALPSADRAKLGFTPILPSTELWLGSPSPGYVQILEVDAKPKRTRRAIVFRKAEDHYVWVGEMELHYGPGTYTTFQGSAPEKLVFEYATEPYGGMQTSHQLRITYYGQDVSLQNRNLALSDVQPVLERWERSSRN